MMGSFWTNLDNVNTSEYSVKEGQNFNIKSRMCTYISMSEPLQSVKGQTEIPCLEVSQVLQDLNTGKYLK